MKIKTLTIAFLAILSSVVGCSSSDSDKPVGSQPVDASVDSDSDTTSDAASVCAAASDCVAPAGPCQLCDDAGTVTVCPTADCIEGACVVSTPSCESDGGSPEASPDPADAATE